MLGVGIDVADSTRFRRLLDRSGARLWDHWFTPAEAEQSRHTPQPEYAAAVRFAVKEATAKALRMTLDGGPPWRDVEVLRGDTGYEVKLLGDLAAKAAGIGPYRLHVSTSRCGCQAFATVVIESGT